MGTAHGCPASITAAGSKIAGTQTHQNLCKSRDLWKVMGPLPWLQNKLEAVVAVRQDTLLAPVGRRVWVANHFFFRAR